MWARPPSEWRKGTPEELVSDREAVAYIEKILDELPPVQRAVMTLRDIEGLDPKDVCNILEISETNQRVLLHRARSKLRSSLERYVGRGG